MSPLHCEHRTLQLDAAGDPLPCAWPGCQRGTAGGELVDIPLREEGAGELRLTTYRRACVGGVWVWTPGHVLGTGLPR